MLRNAADFRAHYANKPGTAGRGEQIQISDFLRGVAGMKTSAGVSAALSVGTDSSGGFAVPSLVMPQILEALVPASSLLFAGAGIVPLTEGAKQYTTAAVDNIPTAAWRLESGNLAESAPTFRAVVAAPKSLAFYFKASRELLADAANMDAALNVAIAQAFAKELIALACVAPAPTPSRAHLEHGRHQGREQRRQWCCPGWLWKLFHRRARTAGSQMPQCPPLPS